MEFNSGVSMLLPDSIGVLENDFDEEDNEDMVHEQTNQNEIVELIMAAFEGHDEPSDGEDDEDDDEDEESLNTSNASHRSGNEHELLNTNNNNNNNSNPTEHYALQHEMHHRTHLYQQPLFSTPAVSTPPPLVPPSGSTELRRFDDHTHSQYQHFDEHQLENELPFRSKNTTPVVHYQTGHRSNSVAAASAPVQYFDTLPTADLMDPMQNQFLYQTSSVNLSDAQNQLNKFRILCNVKERKISELENRCSEFLDKYNSDTRALKHKVELSERAKYDSDQRYQSMSRQCEEMIETNKQMQRTIKDAELRIQQLETNKIQMEKKLDEAETLIDSLHRKVNELQRFESIARTQQDCELLLASTREKHEQELISLNEKLQMAQMNLQEKNIEVGDLRAQLESTYKDNEKAIFERMETINRLNQQLHDCQRQYTDLLTTKSVEITDQQTDLRRQCNRLTEEKQKLEQTCEDLQSEIETLRNRLAINEHEVNNDLFALSAIGINENSSNNRQVVPHNSTTYDNPNESLINENQNLKERIDEFVANEKNLIDINEDLQRQLQELKQQENIESNQATLTQSIHIEQITTLQKEVEQWKENFDSLQEKYLEHQQESQRIIEQLREDIIDLDKTKQLYIDVCQEKNSIEDKLRRKFENEIKIKLDDLHRSLEKDFEERLHTQRTRNQQELQDVINKNDQEIERITLQHEKLVNGLHLELDRLRANDDAKGRLTYVEKEFEQLKEDYYQLNVKQKELLNSFDTLEIENKNLLETIDELNKEKNEIQERLNDEIEELKRLNEEQKERLNDSIHQREKHQGEFQQNLDALQVRINNYENAVSQYEEYRVKLETNLEKITQQRDTNKMDLRLTRDMLNNKENDYNQLKIQLEITEKTSRSTIDQLEEKVQLYEEEIRELKEKDSERLVECRENLMKLETEKNDIVQRLEEANRALNFADSHLKQEIEKIKMSLEQEYNRRYERDQKQHQQDLNQLRQQLTFEFEKQKASSSIVIQSNMVAAQELDEVKKMYRNEIDRLYRENIELNQCQAKLIDTHQKQMQIMKKDLEDGYNKVINEFELRQTHLQAHAEQIKEQLIQAEQTIEHLKRNHANELLVLKEKQTMEQDNRNRQENLQNRLDHLMTLVETEKENFNEERTKNANKEREYQQTISALQQKIAEMIKQHAKALDEIKRELHQERLISQKQFSSRPLTMPQFVQTDLSINDLKSDYIATIDKLRELFTSEMLALLRLTCKMIFDVHHRVGIAHYLDNIESSIRKQIQNELVRSRNSMIKEIRRELFEKMTHAMKSQGVADATIDVHIFELDRLLSQMAQDCLDSLSTSASTSSTASLYCSLSSNSSLMTPQRSSTRTIIHDSSSLIKSKIPENNSTPLRKSIESLYTTPIHQKSAAPLAPHCHTTLDSDRRPKSASTILLANQNSSSSTVLSPRTHKFQRTNHRNFKMKMYRSEDDLMYAVERHHDQQQRQRTDLNDENDDEDTLTVANQEKEETPVHTNVRALARQFEQKTNSLPDHQRPKLRSPENHQVVHHAAARTIISEQVEENEEDRLTWPQQAPSTPTPTSGIKKLVRHGIKLLTTTQTNQQQTKKSSK